MKDSPSCIVCRKALANIDERGNQPSGGLEFTTSGHYGSTVFDPMDGTKIAVNVCDACLTDAKEAKRVLVIKGPRVRLKPIYSVWR